MINRAAEWLRRMMLAAAGNVSLYIFTAFLVVGVLPMDVLKWYRETFVMLERFVVVPWGMALCLLRLERRKDADVPLHADAAVLFVLLAWMVAPFALRFGITFNNIGSWCSHATAFFGVYLLITETESKSRENLLDLANGLFLLLGILWGGALLWCAATGKTFGSDPALFKASGGTDGLGFGIFRKENLCAGLHYNTTGMLALCIAMLNLSGACRSGNRAMKGLYALSFAMQCVVIVLTQSRTARYALIVSLAAGAYGWFVSRRLIRRAWLSHAAGLAAAALVLAAAYQGAAMLTDAALRHYAQSEETAQIPFVRMASAQEENAAEEQTEPAKARAAVDATLSGRTDIWRNLFKLWKSEPKYLIIGNGIGRTGSRIVQGTIHERNGAVAVHNTYLQFIADFGLIGFGLMAAFLALMAAPVVRSLFFDGGRGYRPLGMMVVAALMTGMMESAPLGAMTPMNMILMFSLALIVGHGRERCALVQ